MGASGNLNTDHQLIIGDKLNKCKRGIISTDISERRNGKLGVS